MKLSVKPVLLKLLTLAASGLGLMLHVVLLATGIDEKGLLISEHWAGRGLWILTAAMVAIVFLLTRPIRGSARYRDAHPASVIAGIGAMVAAGTVAYTAFGEFAMQSITITALSLATAICLAVIGICRIIHSQPNFLLHAVVSVYFAIRMVTQYQNWNSDPQVLDYAFYLGAYILLMLSAYQHATFDAGMGSHRDLWCTGLLAAFLCFVSLTSTVDTWLLLGCGIWSITNLTDLKIRRRMRTPSQEEV